MAKTKKISKVTEPELDSELYTSKKYEETLIARVIYPHEAKNPNNAYYRSANTGKGFRGMFMKPDYKAYKEGLVNLASNMVGEEHSPSTGPIKIVSHWVFGTNRRKDLQNTGKLEFDAFNGIFYEDDSQIIELHSYKHYNKNKPCVIIEIYELKEV